MQHYHYGHNRPVYLRQLGRLYVDRPELARPLLAELEEKDYSFVVAEVAIALAERHAPFRPIELLRAELFGA